MRSVARSSAIALVAASSAGASPTTDIPGSHERSRPNILIVMTDDQRAHGSLGVMPRTRHIFMTQGRTYQAYATTPLCCPSRASIYTGQYVHNHGLIEEYDDESFDPHRGSFHEKTIQRRLNDAGYLTGLFGKYLNGWSLSDNPPHLDRWAISRGAFYEDSDWNVDGQIVERAAYHTDVVANEAVRFIEAAENDDAQPWFLVLTPLAPHPPAIPADEYALASVPRYRTGAAFMERNRRDKPDFVRSIDLDERVVRRQRIDQLRSLMSVDDLVARVFRTLALERERAGTLAFFVSDNGFLWGEHGLSGKWLPYEGSVRIPMMMRWPGVIVPGLLDRRLTANIDIAPTILDAADLPVGHDVDGRSLLDGWNRDRLLTEFFGHRGWPPWAATNTSRYRYVEYYDPQGKVTFREYYDLRRDPAELANLLADADASNDPDVGSLSAQLAADRRCRSSGCP